MRVKAECRPAASCKNKNFHSINLELHWCLESHKSHKRARRRRRRYLKLKNHRSVWWRREEMRVFKCIMLEPPSLLLLARSFIAFKMPSIANSKNNTASPSVESAWLCRHVTSGFLKCLTLSIHQSLTSAEPRQPRESHLVYSEDMSCVVGGVVS